LGFSSTEEKQNKHENRNIDMNHNVVFRHITMDEFINTISQIETYHDNHNVRNRLVIRAYGLTKQLGYESGFYVDPTDSEGLEYPIMVIDLPGFGEISWHVPTLLLSEVDFRAWPGLPLSNVYDMKKYNRIRAFVDMAQK
jgi:hypothetical protein